MNKARLIGFTVPKKNSEINKKAKRKSIYQQITNHKTDNNNTYSKPDRFALARFNRDRLNSQSLAETREAPYRSRAAFKLLEIEDKYQLCAQKKRIVDLGAAPGGWLQVALELSPNAKLLGIDQKPIAPLNENSAAERLHIMQENLQKQEKFPIIAENIIKMLGGKPDCIISDIAPNTIGAAQIDNDRFASLLENIMPLVYQLLAQGGDFLTKLRHSAAEKDLLNNLKARFSKLHLIKPQASRKSANEIYLLAKKFHS